jgi:hypothetical protein
VLCSDWALAGRQRATRFKCYLVNCGCVARAPFIVDFWAGTLFVNDAGRQAPAFLSARVGRRSSARATASAPVPSRRGCFGLR